MSAFNLFDIYSKTAGVARAVVILLGSVVAFLNTAGPIGNNPLAAKISVAVVAAVEFLTRFTSVGNTVKDTPKLGPQV